MAGNHTTADPGFNLAGHCVGTAAGNRPGHTALIVVSDADAPADAAEQWTFGELDDAVRAVAAGLLGCGLRPGDRVLLRLGNTSDFALLYFGAIAAGLVAVPSSAQLTGQEARFLLADSGASALVVADDLAIEAPDGIGVLGPRDIAAWRGSPERAAYAHTAPEDPAFLVYTSGTTGRPKGVLHAHRSALGRAPMHKAWLDLHPTDRMLHAGSLNWTYTLGVGLADPWANGATAIVYNGPRDPGVWPRLIDRFGATLFAAVPGVYRQLLRQPDFDAGDLSTLRHGVCAGEALRPALHRRWRERTGLELYEAFGMSEISTFISSGPGVATRPGSPGKVQPGRRIAVLDPAGGTTPLPTGQVGLLAVHRSDPGLMLGYWNRPNEQAAVLRGDWFVGGDLAHIDADGYVVHHGRADDVITALGYRVSPVEVEEVLLLHPAVAEAMVTEVWVRDGVSVIAAFVVPREPGTVDAETLLEHTGQHLASYKRPRRIEFVDSLPRTANGKLQRRKLPAPFGQVS